MNGKLIRSGVLTAGLVVQRGDIVTGQSGATANAAVIQGLVGSMHSGAISTEKILPPATPDGPYTLFLGQPSNP